MKIKIIDRINNHHALGAIIIAITALLFKCGQHFAVHSYYWDLMFTDHAIWNMTQGKGLYVSMYNLYTFSDHFYPYFYPISLLYWIKASPVWLFIIQAICFGLMAYPILKIASDHFEKKWTWALVGYMLAYYPLRCAFIQDLHGEILMAPLIAWALYSIYTKRYGTAIVCTGLLMATKESAILLVLPLCALIRYQTPYKKTALALGLTCLVMAYGVLSIFMPSFGHVESYAHWDKYSDLGHSFQGILATTLTHPMILTKKLFSPQTLGYLVGLGLPFAGLSFCSIYALVGGGIFAQNILANASTQMSNIATHCTIPLIPIGFWAFVATLISLKQKNKLSLRLKKNLIRLALVCVTLNTLLFIFTEARIFVGLPKRYQVIQKIHKQLPPNAAVAASGRLIPHFEYRQKIYDTSGISSADYVILEGLNCYFPRDVPANTYIKQEWHSGSKIKAIKALIMGEEGARFSSDEYVRTFDQIKKNPRFKLILADQNIFFYKRISH